MIQNRCIKKVAAKRHRLHSVTESFSLWQTIETLMALFTDPVQRQNFNVQLCSVCAKGIQCFMAAIWVVFAFNSSI